MADQNDGNPNRRCAHGKLFTESCPGCGYVHPQDRDRSDGLLRQAAQVFLWQQVFGGCIAIILMMLALFSVLANR